MAFTANRSLTSSVLVRRFAKGIDADAASAVWNYDTGSYGTPSDYVTLGVGRARVQPNKDLSARSYEFGDEMTVFQAVRIDVSWVDWAWDTALPADEREFRDEDQILITRNFFPNLDSIKKYIFIVRNPLMSGNAHWQNLLCDMNMKGGISRGDPK